MESLWGPEYNIDDDSALIKKAKGKKVVDDPEKIIKSKRVDVEDKIAAITDEVHRILGEHAEDTVVITNKEDLHTAISIAIADGGIAIDTETNNTLDWFNCKLMGLCFYSPGQKASYVPVNHVNRLTEKRLDWQVTEEDIKEELQRLNDTFIVMHNASFDIKVLWKTCGHRLHVDWDVSIACKLIDENELAALKSQYALHVDKTHGKYDIKRLFQGLQYAIFDPDLFALYAATDAMMTWKVFLYQRDILRQPDMQQIYKLYQTLEIPTIDSVVDMEWNGVTVDKDYAALMTVEYTQKSNAIQVEIDAELQKLEPQITLWRLSNEANEKPIGKNGKPGKSKSEQLKDPPELSSPTQLAIILYDILKVDVLDKSAPRSTAADILEELSYKYEICKLIVDKRGVDILLNTFISKMNEIAKSDGKVHTGFNQYGAKTGRFSSSGDLNLQNIPSHDKLIRMIFRGSTENRKVEPQDNMFTFSKVEEVETVDGWKFVYDIREGDHILTDEGVISVTTVRADNKNIYVYYGGDM